MNAEDFIKNNPFPENGAELNLKLVADIQNPDLIDQRQKNIEKLFRLNARLIWLMYEQNSYGESLDSVMSFMYEGIAKSSMMYKFEFGVPFYIYAMNTTRAMLQRYKNYHGSLIHIPVRKRGDENFVFTFNDITEYMDLEFGANENLIEKSDDFLESVAEVFELAEKYIRNPELSNETRQQILILLELRKTSLVDLSKKYGITESKLKKIITKIVGRIKTFGGSL